MLYIAKDMQVTGAAETKPSYGTVAMTGTGTTGEAGRTTIGEATAEIVVAIIMTTVGMVAINAAEIMVIGDRVAAIITTKANMVAIIAIINRGILELNMQKEAVS